MEVPSPPSCPLTVTVRRNPHRRARPAPSPAPIFPLSDLETGPTPPDRPTAENLRVYLRIRPLVLAARARPQPGGRSGHNPKMDAGAKKVKKKSGGEICLVATGSHSVTLTPPSSLGESKRLKHEAYEGFSRVFAPDSVQEEVYLTVMEPLVESFLRGRNGLLVAMGPTGSGKTHTVFGTPREPGLVPRALQRLFGLNNPSDTSGSAKSYFLSMFEIYSEKGKSEKMIDLFSGGADLYLQQSTVKGLSEAKVSSVTAAHSVITQGLLKRTTAATNSNNQSSRSQCVINIRSACNTLEDKDENDSSCSNAVLTIVDLAGAERETKTGNQGVRLLESNFINNTSMVFGLCLRSLLEHQKNPKKPLQKHYHYSLLTKYLREYLEGKKQMTLLLTVKPGEVDYLDTSLLLRQASPYMNIKYSNPGESFDVPNLKRQASILARTEKLKRRKFLELGGKGASDNKPSTIVEEKKHESFQPKVPDQWNDDYCMELAKEKRLNQITLGFSRALWKVLKEYKQRLQDSENEVGNLKELLEKEKDRTMELEKELIEVKSCLLNHDKKLEEASAHLGLFEENSSKSVFSHTETEKEFECLLSTPQNDEMLKVASHVKANKDSLHEDFHSLHVCMTPTAVDTMNPVENLQFPAGSDSLHFHMTSTSTDIMNPADSLHLPAGGDVRSSLDSLVVDNSFSTEVEDEIPKSPKQVCTGRCQIEEVSGEERNQVSTPMPLNEEKPRRTWKLVPVSSLLLKEMSYLGMRDESTKSNKKKNAEERAQTQGSVTLVRMLRNNFHL